MKVSELLEKMVGGWWWWWWWWGITVFPLVNLLVHVTEHSPVHIFRRLLLMIQQLNKSYQFRCLWQVPIYTNLFYKNQVSEKQRKENQQLLHLYTLKQHGNGITTIYVIFIITFSVVNKGALTKNFCRF